MEAMQAKAATGAGGARRDDDVDSLKAELPAYRRVVREVSQVCREAARGNLEPRLLKIAEVAENAALAGVMHDVNHLLDLTDAFVRESSASLEHAARGAFHRRFLERGMLGTFQNAARTVNESVAAMEQSAAKLDEARAARLTLADEFESTVLEIVSSVASAATQVRANAQSLNQSAEANARHVEEVSAAAEEASQNMDTIASATEELSSTVRELSRQAMESSTSATDASQAAAETRETVRGLSQASHEISSVVKLITDVAGQTRLLALNATIEAARAGDAGRGFAVVAGEVKNLASQTAGATEDIQDRVTRIHEATRQAVEAIATIGTTIDGVNSISTTMEASVAEQQDATAEISRSLAEAARRTRDVSHAIGEVTQGTHHSRDAASQVLEASDELAALAEGLRGSVSDFLSTVRRG